MNTHARALICVVLNVYGGVWAMQDCFCDFCAFLSVWSCWRVWSLKAYKLAYYLNRITRPNSFHSVADEKYVSIVQPRPRGALD